MTKGTLYLQKRLTYKNGDIITESRRIPGNKNIPLQAIDKTASVIENKGTPLFVCYCSGSRSRQAASMLQRMGYASVTNIGGIAAYSGKVEH